MLYQEEGKAAHSKEYDHEEIEEGRCSVAKPSFSIALDRELLLSVWATALPSLWKEQAVVMVPILEIAG